jgi:LacI family transcriptional regulator
MAQDPGEIGRQAAEIVFARLAGDDSPFETRYVPSILTRRGSGEIPAPASTPAP